MSGIKKKKKKMPFKDPVKAREYNRIKKREYYQKDPQKYNKKRIKYKTKRVSKEKQKEYSQRYYSKNVSKVIEYSKNYRKKFRDDVNEKQRDRNRIKDPTIRIGDALRDYLGGVIDHSQFYRRVQDIVTELDEKFNQITRRH